MLIDFRRQQTRGMSLISQLFDVDEEAADAKEVDVEVATSTEDSQRDAGELPTPPLTASANQRQEVKKTTEERHKKPSTV